MMLLSAATPSVVPRMPAGSDGGPTQSKSLRAQGWGFSATPSATRLMMVSLACMVIRSASPRRNGSAISCLGPVTTTSVWMPVACSKRSQTAGHRPVSVMPPMTAQRTTGCALSAAGHCAKNAEQGSSATIAKHRAARKPFVAMLIPPIRPCVWWSSRATRPAAGDSFASEAWRTTRRCADRGACCRRCKDRSPCR